MNVFTKQLNNIIHYLSDNNIEIDYKNNQVTSLEVKDYGKDDSVIVINSMAFNGELDKTEVVVDPMNFVRSDKKITI